MARPKIKRKGLDWKELLVEEKDFFKNAIQEVVQEVLEAEMDETVEHEKGIARPTLTAQLPRSTGCRACDGTSRASHLRRHSWRHDDRDQNRG